MSGFKPILLCFIGSFVFQQILCLVELPQVEDNDILNTEAVIRHITNQVFSTLHLKGVKTQPKLKNYALIHNYFVSLTLQDYKSLKEIARLTRVDNKNCDNGTTYFIAILNETLSENYNSLETKQSSDASKSYINGIKTYIDEYAYKLKYLQNTYGAHSAEADANKDVVEILSRDKWERLNETIQKKNIVHETLDNDNVLDESEFWVANMENQFPNRRIYDGKNVKIKYYPFMASVHMFNNFQCAGSIIKHDLVITAASCLQLVYNNRFYRENPAFLAVRVGSNFYFGGGEVISVLEVYFYPTYNPKNLNNNLAIMRLTRDLNFKKKNRKRITYVPIDTTPMPLETNSGAITIIGWGAKTASNIIKSPWENRLSFADLPPYELQDCQEVYTKEYVTHRHFCGGYMSKGGGACNRDVGGPGLVSNVLKGVVSFGSPVCGARDTPTVFTKVGFYADWIVDIMDQYVPKGKKETTTTQKYDIIFPSQATENTYYLTPIEEHHHSTPPFDDVTSPKGLRDDTEDKTLFKDFLKTVFESKEVDDYFEGLSIPEEIVNIDLNTAKQHKAPTTIAETVNTQVTLLQSDIKEGEESLIESEETTEKDTARYSHVTALYDEPESKRAPKQKQIVKLIRTTTSQTNRETVTTTTATPVITSETTTYTPTTEVFTPPISKTTKHAKKTKTKDVRYSEKELKQEIANLLGSSELRQIIKEAVDNKEIAAAPNDALDEESILALLLDADEEDKAASMAAAAAEELIGTQAVIEPQKALGDDAIGSSDIKIADIIKKDVNKIVKDDSSDVVDYVDESDSQVDDGESMAIGSFKDFTYRNQPNDTDIVEIMSKHLLLDILKEVADDPENRP